MTKKIWLLSKKILVVALAAGFFASCGDVSRKVNEKIEELTQKSESLDSLVNNEINEILPIDSLMKTEQEKFTQIDSLVQKPIKKLDSIVNIAP